MCIHCGSSAPISDNRCTKCGRAVEASDYEATSMAADKLIPPSDATALGGVAPASSSGSQPPVVPPPIPAAQRPGDEMTSLQTGSGPPISHRPPVTQSSLSALG